MNGSTENRAHGASEKPGRRETTLSLATAASMLPLVRRILDDILHDQKHLAGLLPEQNRLDRHRRDLSWPERARRYQIQAEVSGTEQHLQESLSELAGLGLQLLDGDEGRVGFPTIVNGRRAFFSWQPGDEGIDYWQFPDETTRRSVPASWRKATEIGLASKN
jgi:hypothetical protein